MVSLSLCDIEARYGRRVVWQGASTPEIAGGRLTALIGANAAGKSTLFRRIAGQLAGRGEVRLTGADAAELRYMPQDTGMTAALTVYESLLLALKLGGMAGWRLSPAELRAADAALARLRIPDLADRMLGELSGGQRQLVSIAQTLVCQPRVVLMDEPTSALDLARQYEVLELLRDYAAETGAVVILALHDLNQVLRACPMVLAVGEGRILAAGPTEDVLDPPLIRRIYRVEARIERCSRGHPVLIVDRTSPNGDGSAAPGADRLPAPPRRVAMG